MAVRVEEPPLAEQALVGQPLVLRVPPDGALDDDAFYKLCRANPDLRLERDAEGSIIIMSPAGFRSGARNADVIAQLYYWAVKDGTGVVTDSSAGFSLPNGAVRGPDASWTLRERVERVPLPEQEQFPRLVPDFVGELRSRSDRLSALKEKMAEYRSNGVRLGWLIDPYARSVWVYTADDEEPRLLRDVQHLSGDPVLPGFVLDLSRVW